MIIVDRIRLSCIEVIKEKACRKQAGLNFQGLRDTIEVPTEPTAFRNGRGESMSLYEKLSLLIAFATLVATILNH